MRLQIENVEKKPGRFTKLTLEDSSKICLRPFLYVKKGDVLEFIPSLENFREIYKIFNDRATGETKKVKLHPPYSKNETIFLPPHEFKVIFRERYDSKDWERFKDLEQFHYRGKGLHRLVGRRTVLLAEIDGYGMVGFGVLSATLPNAKPRFDLLKTNFTKQMRSGLINRIVRIPRIVIHPEFRGMSLGVLMAKHLVQYSRRYWDINNYTPIMVEVIAAMTEYHKFFEKAGFIRLGYTLGYDKGVLPLYGNGSFQQRENHKSYDFMRNQKPKPYLVFPLDSQVKKEIRRCYHTHTSSLSVLPKIPKLKKPIILEKVTVSYKIKNSSTEKTKMIKEIFGVDVESAFSTIFTNLSLKIDPSDVILITGASGSGKSTVLRLLTLTHSKLKKEMEIHGNIHNKNTKDIAILNKNWDNSLALIDQVKKGKDIKEAINLLNSVGLSEAHLYIKRPNQISDGQKYRFAVANLCDSGKPIWIADEFASTLNPEMSAIVAKGLRKVAYKYGATLILAASHTNSFLGSLLPNKLIKLRWGTKPTICSLKTQFSLNENKILLQIINNGIFPLTNLQIGLNKLNGALETINSHKYLAPNQTIEESIDSKNSYKNRYYVTIKTTEGVGDILFFSK